MRSRRSRICALAAFAASILAANAAAAPPRDPHVGYVFPAGGRQGTTFQATAAGQYLENATAVLVSGEGVSATILAQERQLTPKEQNELKETIAKLQEKRRLGTPLTAEDIKAGADAKKKLDAFGRRLANPSLGEFITLEVTVAANAAPGDREVRLRVQGGLSNPLVFVVGDLPEVTEEPWRNVPAARGSMAPGKDANPAERRVQLPVTLNGQIPPGGVDRWRFSARAGQRLVARVRARGLIPYVADAVPGWFQAKVALYAGTDVKGREVAYADDWRFRPDPVLLHEVTVDGEYVLEVTDALYRGREDFVYRITVGEVPFVTDVFPLGGRVGERPTVAVSGWNLPAGASRSPIDLSGRETGAFPWAPGGLADLVPFHADPWPQFLEAEAEDSPEGAQAVPFPAVIDGRIDRPGDVDVFRVEGAPGKALVAEVLARRLGSPVDSVLVVTDATGKPLAFDDDHEDRGAGLDTHHADSYVSLTLPATGACFVRIGDTQRGGGPAYAYRLRVGPPRPDFELRVTPSSLNVRAGSSVPLTVHALRRDGFAGEIAVNLADPPAGFTLSGARIQEGQDRVQATFNAPPAGAAEPFRVVLEGRATIAGREVVRRAVPADDVMQSFAYRHLMPARDLLVAVLGRGRPAAAAAAVRILTPTPVRIPAGGTARIVVGLPPYARSAMRLTFELSKPPDGISIESVKETAEGREIVLVADAAKVKPGLAGNLILAVSGERGGAGGTPAPARPAGGRGTALGSLPAIPFEIVKP